MRCPTSRIDEGESESRLPTPSEHVMVKYIHLLRLPGFIYVNNFPKIRLHEFLRALPEVVMVPIHIPDERVTDRRLSL